MLCKVYSPLRFFSKVSERKCFGEFSGTFLLRQRRNDKERPNQRSFSSSSRSSCTVLKQLTDSFPSVVQDIHDDPIFGDVPEALNYFKDTLENTVATGNKCSSTSLVMSYKYMEDAENITPENVKLANILGWCVEMMQAAKTVMDKQDVDSKAVVDVVLLENYIYQLLKKHFSHLPMYVPAIQLLQETFLRLALGEIVDGIPLEVNPRNVIMNCTKERYQTIIKHKTTSLTFELPYGLARCLANKYHTEIPPQTQEIFKKLGEFHQIQNDFLNVYGDTASDIENGKCTWLLIKALENRYNLQRRLFGTYYGKKGPESIKIIKDMYNALGIPKAYAMYEEDAFNFIGENIEQVSKLFCHELMFKRLDKFYQPYI